MEQNYVAVTLYIYIYIYVKHFASSILVAFFTFLNVKKF